jgi:integrase/recombinase XerD
MTSIELEKMRCACHDLREKALVDFLYSTGARVSEVRAGLITDVDIASGVYLIRHGKGDKERKTYLNAEALLSLQAYLSTRKDDSPYLFVSARGHHSMTSKAIQDIISKIRARTDITKRITPHAFRRTTATIGTANGMAVQEMQKLLGHANINTTMRYVAVADESVKTDHSKYIA